MKRRKIAPEIAGSFGRLKYWPHFTKKPGGGERGFEPSVELPPHRFSRPSRSTTPAPLLRWSKRVIATENWVGKVSFWPPKLNSAEQSRGVKGRAPLDRRKPGLNVFARLVPFISFNSNSLFPAPPRRPCRPLNFKFPSILSFWRSKNPLGLGPRGPLVNAARAPPLRLTLSAPTVYSATSRG